MQFRLSYIFSYYYSRCKPPTFGVLCKSRERRYSERTGQQVQIMRGTMHPIQVAILSTAYTGIHSVHVVHKKKGKLSTGKAPLK